jgi:hypothetical protein
LGLCWCLLESASKSELLFTIGPKTGSNQPDSKQALSEMVETHFRSILLPFSNRPLSDLDLELDEHHHLAAASEIDTHRASVASYLIPGARTEMLVDVEG